MSLTAWRACRRKRPFVMTRLCWFIATLKAARSAFADRWNSLMVGSKRLSERGNESMTTIAFKDGYVASDTAVEWQGTIMGYVNKIVRTKHGGLAGAAGDACFCNEFLKWFKAGE